MNDDPELTDARVTLRFLVPDGPVIPSAAFPDRRVKIDGYTYEFEIVTGREEVFVSGKPTTGRRGTRGTGALIGDETAGRAPDELVDGYRTLARGEMLRLLQNGTTIKRAEP